MNPPVAPELFDVITQYAQDIEQGKVQPTPSLGATSPALTFCENFYGQFFQNRLNQPIEHFGSGAKNTAVRLCLTLKDKNGPLVIIRLVTWFEKLCDIYPNVLALGYGAAGKAIFFDFHDNYLPILLERVSALAQAEHLADIEQKAKLSLSALRKALQLIPR